MHPRPAFNQQFLYEKVFSLGEFMAAGLLVVPARGEKQAKSSKDNNYVRRTAYQTFVVLSGVVEVLVHRTQFRIAPGGMFCVPMGNTYNIRNVSDENARIFFAQARNVYAPLTPVVHDGHTVFSHGDALQAVHAIHAASEDGASAGGEVRGDVSGDESGDESTGDEFDTSRAARR